MPRQKRGHRLSKEEPNVRSASGAGTLDRNRHIPNAAGIHKRHNVALPVFAIEIDGEKRTCFIEQHGIYADNARLAIIIVPQKMPTNDIIGYRD